MIESLIVLLAALLVILFGGPGLAMSDGERADRLRQKAKALYGQGQLSEATGLMEEAVELLKKSAGPDHPETRTAMDILAALRMEHSAN